MIIMQNFYPQAKIKSKKFNWWIFQYGDDDDNDGGGNGDGDVYGDGHDDNDDDEEGVTNDKNMG